MNTNAPNIALLFDVDGVLTNPTTKQVQPALITALSQLLQSGYLITFNTGRSISWLEQPLLQPLIQSIDQQKAQNLLAIGEKGGTWIRGSQLSQAPIET